MNRHQVKCFNDFIQAVPWADGVRSVPLKLTTQQGDGDPKKRHLSMGDQRAAFEKAVQPFPSIRLELFRNPKKGVIHMRYCRLVLASGPAILYVFESGLDMEDEFKLGKARKDTYVLEFASVPPGLDEVIKVK